MPNSENEWHEFPYVVYNYYFNPENIMSPESWEYFEGHGWNCMSQECSTKSEVVDWVKLFCDTAGIKISKATIAKALRYCP